MPRTANTPFVIAMHTNTTEGNYHAVNVPGALKLNITPELVGRIRAAQGMMKQLDIDSVTLNLKEGVVPLYLPSDDVFNGSENGIDGCLLKLFNGVPNAYVLADGFDDDGERMPGAIASSNFELSLYLELFDGVNTAPNFIPEKFDEDTYVDGNAELKQALQFEKDAHGD